MSRGCFIFYTAMIVNNTTDALKLIRDTINQTFTVPAFLNVALYPLDTEDFHTFPASSTWYKEGKLVRGHHCYFGGLLVHTAQVLQLGVAQVQALQDPYSLEVLVMATIWHDWAKLWDYAPEINVHDRTLGHVNKQEHSYQHHHVYRSAVEFEKHATGLPAKFVFDVVHCILSHHGRPEWGSVITPQSKAAFILHASDNLSAKFYGQQPTA